MTVVTLEEVAILLFPTRGEAWQWARTPRDVSGEDVHIPDGTVGSVIEEPADWRDSLRETGAIRVLFNTEHGWGAGILRDGEWKEASE